MDCRDFVLRCFSLLFIAGGGWLFCLRVVEEGFISLRMIQRDYLMRMVQEFINMLMIVLESKKAGDWGAVEEDLDRAAKTFLGLDREAVCRLGAAALKRRLVDTGPTHEYKVRAQVVSRILTESAAAAAGRGEDERERALLLKALHLLLDTLLDAEPVELLDFTPRVEGIVESLGAADLPSSALLGLMQYHEYRGDFAQAEDWLFRLCDSSPAQGGLAALGEGFYRRLSAQPDSILAGGGLPREEVEAGWKEFRRQCGR